MNGNEYPAQHVGLGANGAAKIHSAPRSSKLGSRPLTVDEAFPYSPFASVAPFNSGILTALHEREEHADSQQASFPYQLLGFEPQHLCLPILPSMILQGRG